MAQEGVPVPVAASSGDAQLALDQGTTPLGIPVTSISLTIRLLMQSRDVGCIIGKGGCTIQKFRAESGAHINITDGGAERIVTITGHTTAIFMAFSLICKKVEEDSNSSCSVGSNPPVSLRLLLPASQCGPLIGKGGCKIKELREATGATVQVAGELLPGSTERAVTVSGTSDALSQCLYRISCVMLENPVRGATIPYRPRQPATAAPAPAAAAAAAATAGMYGYAPQPYLATGDPFAMAAQPNPLIPQLKPVPSHMANGGALGTSVDMAIANELVGCIIGRGGSKIAEIRRISGAMIKIANAVPGCNDRHVTISGSQESVCAAQQMINARIESEMASKPILRNTAVAMDGTNGEMAMDAGVTGSTA